MLQSAPVQPSLQAHEPSEMLQSAPFAHCNINHYEWCVTHQLTADALIETDDVILLLTYLTLTFAALSKLTQRAHLLALVENHIAF